MTPYSNERLHEIEDQLARRFSGKQSVEFLQWVLERHEKVDLEVLR